MQSTRLGLFAGGDNLCLGFRDSFLGFRFFTSARNVKIFTLNTGVKEKREQENER